MQPDFRRAAEARYSVSFYDGKKKHAADTACFLSGYFDLPLSAVGHLCSCMNFMTSAA